MLSALGSVSINPIGCSYLRESETPCDAFSQAVRAVGGSCSPFFVDALRPHDVKLGVATRGCQPPDLTPGLTSLQSRRRPPNFARRAVYHFLGSTWARNRAYQFGEVSEIWICGSSDSPSHTQYGRLKTAGCAAGATHDDHDAEGRRYDMWIMHIFCGVGI